MYKTYTLYKETLSACVHVHALLFSHHVAAYAFVSPMQPARLLSPRDFPGKNIEWAVISFPRESYNPGIKPKSPVLAGSFFTAESPGKSMCKYSAIPSTITVKHYH